MIKVIKDAYQRWIVKQYEKIVANDKGKITFLNTIDDKETVERLNGKKS